MPVFTPDVAIASFTRWPRVLTPLIQTTIVYVTPTPVSIVATSVAPVSSITQVFRVLPVPVSMQFRSEVRGVTIIQGNILTPQALTVTVIGRLQRVLITGPKFLPLPVNLKAVSGPTTVTVTTGPRIVSPNPLTIAVSVAGPDVITVTGNTIKPTPASIVASSTLGRALLGPIIVRPIPADIVVGRNQPAIVLFFGAIRPSPVLVQVETANPVVIAGSLTVIPLPISAAVGVLIAVQISEEWSKSGIPGGVWSKTPQAAFHLAGYGISKYGTGKYGEQTS